MNIIIIGQTNATVSEFQLKKFGKKKSPKGLRWEKKPILKWQINTNCILMLEVVIFENNKNQLALNVLLLIIPRQGCVLHKWFRRSVPEKFLQNLRRQFYFTSVNCNSQQEKKNIWRMSVCVISGTFHSKINCHWKLSFKPQQHDTLVAISAPFRRNRETRFSISILES